MLFLQFQEPWLLILLIGMLNSVSTKSSAPIKHFSNYEEEISDVVRNVFHGSSQADQNRNVWKVNDDQVSVFINSSSSQHESDSKFLSVAIDSGVIRYKFKGFDFGSKGLQALAHGLSPCYIRIGGTEADFLTFDPDGDVKSNARTVTPLKDDNLLFDHLSDESFQMKHFSNFTMSGHLWKNLLNFLHVVEWDLMFDFNLFKWRDGLWDPSNAQLLLNYTDALGYDIPAFQLGNEPNSFHYNFNFSIEPSVLVKDFAILRKILSQYPRYRNSQLFGPDVTDLSRHSSSRDYLKGFLQSGGAKLVSEISLHHYYMRGQTAMVGDFVDMDVLDKLKNEIEIGLEITRSQPQPLSIRFTETSSCSGGGAPGLSNAYVAGFLWLDKLGLSARYGVTKVFRQTFFGGHYSLVSGEGHPNPDYFLSLLHKRLILGPVFNLTTSPVNKNLRLYAHCARTDFYSYPKGSLTLAYLNIGKVDSTLTLPQFQGQALLVYSLTPGDDKGLKSRFVKLNGRKLEMIRDQLPPLVPKSQKGDITLPPLTFGFIVVPGADIALCKNDQITA